MAGIPFLFPRETQHLFRVYEAFDGPSKLLTGVTLDQYPRWWYPNACRHSILLRANDRRPPNWETRRSDDGYRVGLYRSIGEHSCPTGYEEELAFRINRALMHDPTAAPAFRSVRTRGKHYEYSLGPEVLRQRPFARSVEEIVRTLAPDFVVTEFQLYSTTRE
jgi:hypothetical protein